MVGPIDILHHTQLVTEALQVNEDFEEKYQAYGDSLDNIGSERRKRVPVLTLGQTHPIIPKLYQAQQELDEFFQDERLNINPAVLEINRIGRLLSELDDVPLVKPDFSQVDQSLQTIWGRRLWREDDFSDATYELEIAAFFHRNGFETYLIEEGEQEGPDVIVRESGEEVWIECKRKRQQAEGERELEKVRAMVADEVWERIDIGDDSFAVDISAEGFLTEEHVDEIATKIAGLIDQQQGVEQFEIDGVSIEIELADYYEGSYTAQEPGFIREALSTSPELDNPLSPFPHLDYEISNERGDTGHIETLSEVSNGRHPTFYNSIMYGYHTAVDYDFLVEWVMNAVETARRDLSGNDPAVAFVDIPHGKFDILKAETMLDHRGDQVTLDERLSQRIWGQLMDSSSLNGILVTTESRGESHNYVQQERPFSSFLNENPRTELPDSIVELFDGMA